MDPIKAAIEDLDSHELGEQSSYLKMAKKYDVS
jgi:hypothetical protein